MVWETRMNKKELVLGIIGGSGIYEIEGVEKGRWIKIPTPYGDPSDEIYTGTLNNIKVAFLLGAWTWASVFTHFRSLSSQFVRNEVFRRD